MLSQAPVVLRQLTISDADVLADLANNKKIWDNLRDFFPFPYAKVHAIDFIKMVSEEKPALTFAIEFERNLCGVISLIGQPDVYRKTAEIGYWLGEQFWGKGIATIAVKLITKYGFDKIDFIRIHAGIFEYNTSSMRVLEKNGYKKECVCEKSVLKNGKIWDEHRYSITK